MSPATFENSYTTGTVEQHLEASKTLGGRTLKADEFTFNMTYLGTTDTAETAIVTYDKPDAEPVKTTLKTGDVLTAKNDAQGKVTFPTLTFAEEGDYTFRISKKVTTDNLNNSGLYYDRTTYTATITVNDDGKGKLTVETPVYAKDAARTQEGETMPLAAQTPTEETPVTAAFTNRYEPNAVSPMFAATKVLTGRSMNQSEFSFAIVEANASFEPVKDENGAYKTVATGANGAATDVTSVMEGTTKQQATVTFNVENLIYTKDDIGTHYYAMIETSTDGNGVTVDDTVAGVTVVVTDPGDGKLTANVTYADGTAPTFTNTYSAS